jgi:hypothetical protein
MSLQHRSAETDHRGLMYVNVAFRPWFRTALSARRGPHRGPRADFAERVNSQGRREAEGN